jgi:hypothetical protein
MSRSPSMFTIWDALYISWGSTCMRQCRSLLVGNHRSRHRIPVFQVPTSPWILFVTLTLPSRVMAVSFLFL